MANEIRWGWDLAADEERLVQLQQVEALVHLHAQGGTGSGKTMFLIAVALQLIANQVRVVWMDFKGEGCELLTGVFLPVLAQRYPHIRPDRLANVSFFSDVGIPLNPISRAESPLRAHMFASLVGELLDGVGQRMMTIIINAARAIAAHGGSPEHLVRLLVDDGFRVAVASGLNDTELKFYWLNTFNNEPRQSIQSARARLEFLLLHPPVRAQLCSALVPVSGSDIINSPMSVIDLGNVPLGFGPQQRFGGGLIFDEISRAVMSRSNDPNQTPVVIIIDEWQRIAGLAEEDLDNLLSQARSKRCYFWLANQSWGQVPSSLRCAIEANTDIRVMFRPDEDDVRGVKNLLPRVAYVDPDRSDMMLSPDEGRRRYVQGLATLPPRHALMALRKRGRASIIRTLNIDLDRYKREAEKVPAEVIERFRRGRFGVPISELAKNPATVDVSLPDDTPAAAVRSTRNRRKAVVVSGFKLGGEE